ncbi:MAG: MotA/TolQ/ExbB proton channel family protein [Planctomycetota bacterium]
MSPLLEASLGYLAQGGAVMVPLVLGTFALYYALGYRLLRLRRGGRGALPQRIARLRDPRQAPHGLLDRAVSAALGAAVGGPAERKLRLQAALAPLQAGLGRGAVLARTIVVIAPLLGLLGTVSGMIEMFASLGDQTFYAQHGGIAQGIAQALFTTQLGLAIAIPGYLLTRLLDRREAHLRDELERLAHLLGREAAA